jgi:hypothetical protein
MRRRQTLPFRPESYAVAYFPLTVSKFQPDFGSASVTIAPSGILTRSLIVAEPAQPCGTTKTAL